jgi:hypothetical protein
VPQRPAYLSQRGKVHNPEVPGYVSWVCESADRPSDDEYITETAYLEQPAGLTPKISGFK